MKTWQADACSNIALIKYMGKLEGQTSNVPTNASLSFTLNKLFTRVRLTAIDGKADRWQPLLAEGLEPIQLSEKGQKRFLAHLQTMKLAFQVTDQCFLVESANSFPSDCGLASSASSFAALTKAAALALNDYYPRAWASDMATLSSLSRKGSGSSCRSFFAPWSEWSGEQAQSVDLPYQDLIHQAVVVEAKIKSVSSSEAHKRVATSELFIGRTARAEKRLQELKAAMQEKQWQNCFEICWAEFWDMHALFETAKPSFGYFSDKSIFVLNLVRQHWLSFQDGPIVTMDAGANVHLLWRRDQSDMARTFANETLNSMRVISTY